MKAHKAGWDTRRVYLYERKFLHRNLPVMKMEALRDLAFHIWLCEGLDIRRVPKVRAGRGIFCPNATSWKGGAFSSYCDFANQMNIVLIPSHRRAPVLIHELTHAMGLFEHDQRFVRRYFSLLEKYCDYKREELIINAAWFGIRA